VPNLSLEASEVIDAGKNAFRPTHADRLRLSQILGERLTAPAPGVTNSDHAAPAAGSGKSLAFGGKWVLAIAVIAALGGGLYRTVRNGSGKSPVPSSSVHPSGIQQGPHVQARESGPRPASQALAPVSEQRRVQAQESKPAPNPQTAALVGNGYPIKAEPPDLTPKPKADSLGEEVAILTRAEKALHNGKAAIALKLLDEHQRRFASGALAQERSAARVQALCALGRTEEANAESARLTRRSPNSPQAAQAKRFCESKSP